MFGRIAGIAALLGLIFSATALAQKPPALPGGFPNKPMKILVGGSAGGGTDIIARVVAQKISENWGRQMVAENHPSAVGGIIAMEMTTKAPPDGYTMLLAASSAMINAALVTKVPYNVNTAFTPISQLTLQPYVLALNNAVPATSLKEFIAYAKARKGALNYGSTGSGGSTHLGMELLKSMAGLDMQHIPYKGGGQAQVALLGGQIQLMFASPVAAMPQVKAGRLKVLGVGSAKRSRLLPDIPTIAESGLQGFELAGWYGLVAPRGVPAPIVAALNKESVQVVNSADIQAKLAADGAEAAEPHAPAEFARIISAEIDRWAAVIKSSNLKFDQ